MKDIFSYLNEVSNGSSFKAELSQRGGYVTFSNSGRRGESKSFQIGIDSILQTLKDIFQNLQKFSQVQDYDEKPWRDLGAQYFSDAVANATSTVQTKPLFSTLSKIIKWANQPILDKVDSDKHITLSEDVVKITIEKIEQLAQTFIPHKIPLLKMPSTSLQLICYGAPGTGKSHHIDEMIDDENAIRTTFHPDTDYATFVGAYKPTMEPMPIHAIVGMDVKHARGENGEKAFEQKIIYKYVPQAFLKAYVAAWSNLEKPFYLVIEEINRGNCAQIFGDLFQLLDRNDTGCSSYPIHADEDIQRFLASDAKGFAGLNEKQKDAIRSFSLHKDNGKVIPIGEELLNGTKLLLPPNLHIWATMNTSDQSLFPIDSAFKRRWNWKYIPIDYDKENWTFAIGAQRYSWGDFLRKINPEIYTLTESADKQMGYYFVKADSQTSVISEDIFLNKVLFYLWTDVFKDYDISSDLFKNKEQNRPFRFSDFFEKDGMALENFIEGLGLLPIDEEETGTEDFLPDENDDSSSRDMSKYSINGEGVYNKRQTVFRALELYIQNHPNLSDEEIIGNWQDLNSGHKNFMEIENVFNARTANNPSQKKRSGYVQRPNGSKIYIKNQWGGAVFDGFVHSFNQKDWGITIVKIKE